MSPRSSAQGDITPTPVHGGAILCAACDGERIVMGGDDGKLVALDAKGEVAVLATDPKRRWIDNVALHPDGAVAWSVGKTAFVRPAKGEDKSFDAPSTVGGLAFAPKGLRLAVAHYGGVTLWFPNMAGKPEISGVGRLAPRRHLQPRQQIFGHRNARVGDARLAPCR